MKYWSVWLVGSMVLLLAGYEIGKLAAPAQVSVVEVEKKVEKEKVVLPPEWATDVITCLRKSTKDLRNCEYCACYPPRWAARMSEMYLRNCIGDQNDVMLKEMEKWTRGDYGMTEEHWLRLADHDPGTDPARLR